MRRRREVEPRVVDCAFRNTRTAASTRFAHAKGVADNIDEGVLWQLLKS